MMHDMIWNHIFKIMVWRIIGRRLNAGIIRTQVLTFDKTQASYWRLNLSEWGWNDLKQIDLALIGRKEEEKLSPHPRQSYFGSRRKTLFITKNFDLIILCSFMACLSCQPEHVQLYQLIHFATFKQFISCNTSFDTLPIQLKVLIRIE
jgi:hypothetical protein